MQPFPFSLCLIVIHAHPLTKHICGTVLKQNYIILEITCWANVQRMIGKMKVEDARKDEYIYVKFEDENLKILVKLFCHSRVTIL